MKKLYFLLIIAAIGCTSPLLAQSLQTASPKNSIQIGKTGYYFDAENPFSFGQHIFVGRPYSKLRFWWPYIGYTRKFSQTFGMRVSIEHFSDNYFIRKHQFNEYPPAFELLGRGFKYVQLNFLYEFSATPRLSFLLAAGPAYRWAAIGEMWYVRDYDQWADVTELDTNGFHEWGIGGAFEVKYKVWRQFSLSAKGEYFRFPDRPKQQFGAGAYLGYDF